MKGITNNPALDAYQRMAVTPVGPTQSVQRSAATEQETRANADQQIAKVTISSEARQLAASSSGQASDPEKVQRLRAALDTNQLSFDSTKIAQRLVSSLA